MMSMSKHNKFERSALQKSKPSKLNVTYLLAVLSRPGTLQILELAEKGIKAHAEMHLQIGLARKQYCVRLSQLVKTGLLEKVGNRYSQTRFGTVVYQNYIPRLQAIMDS